TPSKAPLLASSLHCNKRLVEVGLEVLDVLEPHRDAQRSVENPELSAHFGRQPLMRRRRRMRDQALCVAEIVADFNDAKRVGETERGLLVALHFEGDQGPA